MEFSKLSSKKKVILFFAILFGLFGFWANYTSFWKSSPHIIRILASTFFAVIMFFFSAFMFGFFRKDKDIP